MANSFDMWYVCLVDIYEVCSKYDPLFKILRKSRMQENLFVRNHKELRYSACSIVS